MEARELSTPFKQVGRYTIFQQIASGGMATVHLARFAGPAGFSRVVAVKHLHPHLSADPEFKAMFIEEARLVSRIRHPNVVPTLDVVVNQAELFLVMEYVEGEALSSLRKAARQQQQDIPLAVCSAIMIGALQGLHAAHEARSESGKLLGIVHRDVSPPNIMVGVDGVTMVLDFGVAKAMQAREDTRPGFVKGKSSYMSPEQIRGEPLTRAADIFAAAVVLWELLTTRRLFAGATEQERMHKVLLGADLTPPSTIAARIPAGLDEVVMRGLRANPTERYRNTLEMAEAIEQKIPPASQRVVGEWVARTAAESLGRRAELLKQMEISEISVSAILSDEHGSTTGTGSSPPATYPGIVIGAAPQAKPRPWRQRRAVMGAAGAAALLLLAMIVVAASRHSPSPAAARVREEVGTTVITKGEAATMRVETIQRPPPAAAPLPAAAAPPPIAAEPPTHDEPEPAAQPTELGSRKRGGPGVKDLRAERERGATRKAIPAGHSSRARPVGATGATAPRAETAAPPAPVEPPQQSTTPLKKHVPLVDDQQRVHLLD